MCLKQRRQRRPCTTRSPGDSGCGTSRRALNYEPTRAVRCGMVTRPAARCTSPAARRCSTCGWPQPSPAAIALRHTNRRPFSGRPVPSGVLAELAEAARLEGAILHILDQQETVRVLELAQEAEREMSADPAYRAELADWAGGERDTDGIPGAALGPRSPDSPTPVRDFTPGRPAAQGYEWFEEIPQLAVLSMHFGGRVDWLRA